MRYYTRDRSQDKKTPTLLLGSLIHCILLEPENFEKLFVVKELEDKKRLKRLAKIAHRLRFDIVTLAQVEKAINLCNDVRLNKDTETHLTGEKEKLVKGSILGVPFKGYIDNNGIDFVTDIKSTPDLNPNKFYWSIKKYQYELQGAIYAEMAKKKKFYILGVSSANGLSRVFNLTDHLPIGRDKLERVIKRYKHLQRLTKVFGAEIWQDNTLPSHTY